MEERSQSGVQEDRSDAALGVGTKREGLRWHDLLKRTYRLYSARFWVFFRMAFLPALLAYLFGQAFRLWIRPLFGHRLYLDEIHSHWYDFFLNAATARNFVAGAFYWFLSGLLLAAVATYLLADEGEPRPLADAFTIARERAGPIFMVSLLAWTFFVVCGLVSRFFIWRIVDVLHLRGIMVEGLFALPTLLICGLLARLGLAIPWLVDRPTASLRTALRNSVRLTENWEPFFMFFVIKSAIAGYALYRLVYFALDWLWQRGVWSAALGPWITNLLYISIAAALETPLFIALSILYCEQTAAPEESLPAPVG